MRHRSGIRPEIVITTALLCGTLVVGFATLRDYGIALDEWNADEYGVKALAWYTSGFNDRGMFNDVEETLWYYGPWFQILTALIQTLDIAGHWTTRHAVTLVTGIVGIAMLVPLARRVAGSWAGLTAIILCLTTGYLYGNLFCTPIDIPFLFAMMAATLAIVIMAERTVPSWKATISAGLLTGLAMATRSSGIITQTYLVGAMVLCALDAVLEEKASPGRALVQIGVRAAAALLLAWAAAFALWPWLQVGNPFTQFVLAFAYFASHPASFTFAHWGEVLSTQRLPWSYIPAQLGARLPEIFLVFSHDGIADRGFQRRSICKGLCKIHPRRENTGAAAGAIPASAGRLGCSPVAHWLRHAQGLDALRRRSPCPLCHPVACGHRKLRIYPPSSIPAAATRPHGRWPRGIRRLPALRARGLASPGVHRI
jgi:hypothetical protein